MKNARANHVKRCTRCMFATNDPEIHDYDIIVCMARLTTIQHPDRNRCWMWIDRGNAAEIKPC